MHLSGPAEAPATTDYPEPDSASPAASGTPDGRSAIFRDVLDRRMMSSGTNMPAQ